MLAAGCASTDRAPDARNAEVSAADAAAARDGSRDGGASCPASFVPCGGEVVGSWSLAAVCPAGGSSLTRPCDHPFVNVQACSATANAATCTSVYTGTITLAGDKSATVALSLHAEMAITLTGDCVQALAPGASPEGACTGLTTPSGKKLECTFAAGLCRCLFRTEPETETKHDTYQVSGDELIVTPSTGEKIGGAYCVSGDELTLRGVIGWAYWVLRRL